MIPYELAGFLVTDAGYRAGVDDYEGGIIFGFLPSAVEK